MAKVILEVEEEGSEATAKKILKLEKALEKLEKQVEEISGEPLKLKTDSAEKELKELRDEVGRLDKRFLSAQDRVKKYEQQLSSSKRGTAEFAQAQRGLRRALKSVSDTGKQLEGVIKKLPPEFRKAARSLDEVRTRADRARTAFNKLGATKQTVSDLVKSIGQLRTGVGVLIAALGIRQLVRFGRALIGMVADSVEVKTKLDALIPSLRSFTGSTELAEEVADRLAATAAKLKVPLADLIDPFLGLSAGGKEAGLSIAEINDLFEASLVSARAFGKGAEEVQRLLTGISQVAGKGVASMEEFRQQIGEAIPNAIPALARGLGVTVPEAIAKISSGSLESAIALRALTQGFVELNQEAGLAQVSTLKGDLGGFAVAAEQARKALADGLEPGLRSFIVASTEFLATNKELIVGLGELGSKGLQALSGVVKAAEKAALGIRALGGATRAFGQELVELNALGLRDVAKAVRGIGSALAATTATAEEFVEKITKGFRRILNEGAGTSEELLEQQKKNFKEQAKAAGVAAEEIIKIERTVADEVGKIQEQSLDQRKALAKLAAKDLKEFGKLRVETERRIADELATILSAERDAFTQLSVDLVEIAKKATAARIEAERKATEENLRFFKEIAAGATELTAARTAASNNASTKIKKIELELSIKLAELREKVLEKLKKVGADRVKIAEETQKTISDLQVKAADAIVKELDRIAAASKKAADKRIADEKRIQAELDKSIAKLKQLTEEIAATGDEDGEGGGKIGQLVELTKNLVTELEKAKAGFGDLFGDPGTTKDPGEFLEQSFKDAATLLGGVTDELGFYTDQLQTAGTDTEKLKDFTKQLEDAIGKVRAEFDNFGTAAKERLEIVLGGFEALVEGGQVTQESFKNFGTEVSEVLETAGGSAEKAAGQVGALGDKAKDLEGLKTAGEDAAEGIKKIGEESETSGTKIVKTKDGILAIVNATEKLGEAGEKGAGGVEKLGTAAEKAAPLLEKVADATKKLKEPILDEDQAANLAALGEAAEKAKEPLALVAEPVEKIALGAKDLSETLPGIVEQVGKLTPQLEALKKLLVEDPVDLQAIATQLQEISIPLERIGTSLTAVRDAVVALPEPLEKIREPAKELIELVAKAAEDGSFAQIATALERIAKALPEIPEPIEAFLAALQDLTKLRDEIAQTLKAIADGLAEVGNETILAALGQLEEKLAEIVKNLGAAKTLTEDWKGTLEQLAPLLDTAGTNASTFAAALRSDLVPALESTKVKGDEARGAVEELKDETGRSSEAFVKLGEDSHETLTAMVADANAAQAAMASLRGEIEATAAAAANLKAPTSGAGP